MEKVYIDISDKVYIKPLPKIYMIYLGRNMCQGNHTVINLKNFFFVVKGPAADTTDASQP
jgi:hypothetical protein